MKTNPGSQEHKNDHVEHQPLVTVGLLAYNEEKFISEAIESILNQNYENLEIIISDDCSTDNTGEIAKSYIQKFNFIQYYRQDCNIGIIKNFNFVINKSQGKYFVWAGAHDKWNENYINRLVLHLESNNQTVLGFGQTQWMDQQGNRTERKNGFADTSSYKPHIRFCLTMLTNENILYGMFRTRALKRTRLMSTVVGPGALMLMELSLLGTFDLVSGPIWHRRENRAIETKDQRLKRYKRSMYNNRNFLVLPHWYFLIKTFIVVLRAKIEFFQKLSLIIGGPFVFIIRYYPLMIYDIVGPVIRLLKRK